MSCRSESSTVCSGRVKSSLLSRKRSSHTCCASSECSPRPEATTYFERSVQNQYPDLGAGKVVCERDPIGPLPDVWRRSISAWIASHVMLSMAKLPNVNVSAINTDRKPFLQRRPGEGFCFAPVSELVLIASPKLREMFLQGIRKSRLVKVRLVHWDEMTGFQFPAYLAGPVAPRHM